MISLSCPQFILLPLWLALLLDPMQLIIYKFNQKKAGPDAMQAMNAFAGSLISAVENLTNADKLGKTLTKAARKSAEKLEKGARDAHMGVFQGMGLLDQIGSRSYSAFITTGGARGPQTS